MTLVAAVELDPEHEVASIPRDGIMTPQDSIEIIIKGGANDEPRGGQHGAPCCRAGLSRVFTRP